MRINTGQVNAKYAALVVGAALFVAAMAILIVVSGQDENTSGELPDEVLESFLADQNGPSIEWNGDTYTSKRVFSVLFIGVDKTGANINSSSSRGNGQADFLLLAVIDKAERTLKLLPIDRDTMTEITTLGILGNVSGTRTAQISLSHSFGNGGAQSCGLTLEAASGLLLGVRIDYYAALNLDGIAAFNDALGGVTVTIEEDMTSVDPAFKLGATVLLKGELAEKYVRARMRVSDGTNVARMARQKGYLDAAFAKLRLKTAEAETFYLEFHDAIAPYLLSDMTDSFISGDLYNAMEYEIRNVGPIDGEHQRSASGFMEFYPDVESLSEIVLSLFFDKSGRY